MPDNNRINQNILNEYRPLFFPRAIAVVGASANPQKTGHFALRSLLASRFPGPVYPVHAGGAAAILGLKAYPDIALIPENQIDLFIFAIPQHQLLPSLEQAIGKGCRAAIVFAAGFKETGAAGAALEAAIRARADAAGVKIIGPNTLGLFNTANNLNATFVPGMSCQLTTPGEVAVVSQSGGVANLIINRLVEHHLGLSTFVGLGNRANLDFTDLIAYFAADPRTKIIALHIEGMENGRRFFDTAARYAAVKPIIVLGAGFTRAGQQIARSHTGSMAGTEALYRAAFRQAGLLQVNSVAELGDTVKLLLACPPPRANRVAMITHTAGPTILAADIFTKGAVQLAPLQPETQKKLRKEILPPFIPAYNPVDLAAAGYVNKSVYTRSLEVLAGDESVDMVLAFYSPSYEGIEDPNFPPQFSRAARASGKPVVIVYSAPAGHMTSESLKWEQEGMPVFHAIERAAGAITNLVRYYRLQAQRAGQQPPAPEPVPRQAGAIIGLALGEHRQTLLETEAKELLTTLGLNTTTARLARDVVEAVALAKKMDYPVVLKVVAPEIIHKSDVGGVKLNLKNEEELRRAYATLLREVPQKCPAAHILGVAVQPMAFPGTEVIIGAVRDPQFGPAVMCGLGGLWVEILQDTAFRLAPLSRQEAAAMLRDIKGFPVLAGRRGQPGADLAALEKIILRVSDLIVQESRIREIDLNPVLVYPRGYLIADARITLG